MAGSLLKVTKLETHKSGYSTFTLPKIQFDMNFSAMKIYILGWVIALPLLSMAGKADEMNKAYYICHFDTQVTEEIINELQADGFDIIQRDNADHVVYVKSDRHSTFSEKLKKNMHRIVHVDEAGVQHILLEEQPISSPPHYLKVFFNFIP